MISFIGMSQDARNYERQQGEAEAVILCVSDALRRAGRARERLVAEQAAPQLIAAVEQSEEMLREAHRHLMHATYYPSPEQGKFAA